MDFPRKSSRASPYTGAAPSSYNSAAHHGGFYEERGGVIGTADGYVEENGRGEESAYRNRFHGETSIELYRIPPRRKVSDEEIPDLYYSQREKHDHSNYQNARESSPYEYGDLHNHHHYQHHQHQHQHGYPDPRPSRYGYHGQGGSSNNRPVERYSYQASHSRAPYSTGSPSDYHHGRHDQSSHYPNLSNLPPASSSSNDVPSRVESDTSDDYGGASDHYHYNQDHHEESYWPKKPTPAEAARKPPPPPPPLREKVAGVKTVEVAPGVHMRLRGADETWRAIEVDFYMPCECICCANTIFAIQDADFVLCPECRVVSPMDGKEFDGVSDGGVGLGFKMEDLAEWQEDIERQRRTNQRM